MKNSPDQFALNFPNNPKCILKIIACGFKITFDPSYVCTLTIITTAMINIKKKNVIIIIFHPSQNT